MIDVDMRFEWIDDMVNARSSIEAGIMTALQPPPPSPTHSVDSDH